MENRSSFIKSASSVFHITRKAQAQAAITFVRMAGCHRSWRIVRPQTASMFGVVSGKALHQHQILDPIVGLDLVYVMDDGAGWNRSVSLFPHPPMLQDAFAGGKRQPDVTNLHQPSVTARIGVRAPTLIGVVT